jgi:hypothetical protein
MRYRAGVLAVLLALTTAAGFACGESEESGSGEPAVTQDDAARLKERVEAQRERLAAQRQARREARAARIRAERRAARRAQLRAERRAERAAARAEAQAAQPVNDCDPNYSGACLDPNASDYDCAGGSGDGPEYTGYVQVVGSDVHGLDSDGDGYACE